MISISNADRDKAIEFLRAYAFLLQESGICSTRMANARRMALNLANKLERKSKIPQPGTPTVSNLTETDNGLRK